jgi:type II secretory pathway predicted ATPase ExeA
MYHSFFQLGTEPFGVSPDPRFFFAGAQHVEAAASLWYAISERRGFAALIAPPGLGKTTVIVSLLERLRPVADVVFLVHPKLDSDTLLESVLGGLGVSPDTDPAKRTRQLAARLTEADNRNRTCVVILDEAQNLGMEALETVRMLSNFEAPGRKLIQFIFAGQPALAKLLSGPECEQIRQRINIVARLQPLQPSDVGAYIEHRLRVAGAPCNPFTDGAVRRIAAASKGVPRIVNTLCFAALTLAFAASSRTVSEADVAEAVSDLELETRDLPVPAFSVPVQTSRSAAAVAAVVLVVLATLILWTRATG